MSESNPGKDAQDVGCFNLKSMRDSQRASEIPRGHVCTCIYIYIHMYMTVYIILIYNYIYILYVCYSTYGIKSLGFCGSSEMIVISLNRPGCKKPHVLDILGNACCSACQRTRSQMCLMMLPHKQGLKNANENFNKKNEASKHL